MKKSLGLLALCAILLSSCQTVSKTARTADITSSLQSAAVADLEVADQRITHTMKPSKEIRRGGISNIKQAVEHEALAKYGNADVLLEPQYVISKKRTLFGSKITSISVSGRPAYYKNFRSLHDSVWSNPVFRGVKLAKKTVYRKRAYASGNTTSDLAYRSKGLVGYVAPFIGYGNHEWNYHGDCESDATFSMGTLLGIGYQLNPNLYIGIGTGINRDNAGDETFFPLFANPRWYFSKKQKAVFLDLKIGYGLKEGCLEDGGLFAGWALGYNFGKIDLALQYLHQQHVVEYDGRWESGDMKLHFDQIGISIGYCF